MASATPPLSALEEAKQEKAENKAALEALGKKIEKIDTRIEELVPKELAECLSDGERKYLDSLRKDKDALRKEHEQRLANVPVLLNRVTQLEAPQGAGTACNVFLSAARSLRSSSCSTHAHVGAHCRPRSS